MPSGITIDSGRLGGPGWLKWGLSIFVVAIFCSGGWFYTYQEKAMRQKIERELATIARLKVDDLSRWCDDQLKDASNLLSSPFLYETLVQVLESRSDGSDLLLKEFASLAVQHDYANIILFSADGGVIARLNDREGMPLPVGGLAWESRADSPPFLTDIQLSEDRQHALVATVLPLPYPDGGDGSVLGVLGLVNDLCEHIYPVLATWPVPTSSAETLLVERRGDKLVYLNERRHREQGETGRIVSFAERKDTVSALAAGGKYGFYHGYDYRGEKVAVVALPIPGRAWVVVAKMDETEAYSEWQIRSLLMLILAVGGSFIIGLGVVALLQREKKNHYQALYSAETAFRQSGERHRIVLEAIDNAVVAVDIHGRVELLNNRAQQLTGWNMEDAAEKPIDDILQLFPVAGQKEQVVLTGEISRVAEEFTTPRQLMLLARDKSWRPIAIRGSVIHNDPSQPTGLVYVFQDLLKEQEAERALHRSEAHFQSVFEQVPVGIALVDKDGRWLQTNKRFSEIFGYTLDELHDHHIREISHPDDIPRNYAYIIDLLAGRRTSFQSETRCIHKSGEVIWIKMTVALARDAGSAEDSFVIVIEDISERKAMAKARAESEARLSAALASMTDALCITDAHGTIMDFNLAWARFCRYATKDECFSQLAGHRELFEVFFEDGSPVPPDSWAVSRALRGEKKNNVVYRIRRHDTGEQWIGSYSFGPIRDEDGNIDGAVLVARDITDLRAEEEVRQKLEAMLQQAQKMEAVGQLAGGVAHDFNNMLSVILGHAEIARDEILPESPIAENLRQIENAALRSTEIIRQLLAFARKQTISPKVIDVNRIIGNSLKMLRRLVGEGIELVYHPGDGGWQVFADPSQIDQILANLVVNSRDAIGSVGVITVATENVLIDEEFCRHHREFTPGHFVLINVRDDGCGMSSDVVERIFEPFFTTKGVGEGTGLGLSTVFGIVKQNNGFISVFSEPGQGTHFRIYLPRHDDAAQTESPEESAAAVAGGTEVILLVEDEGLILKMTQEMLRRFGYSVVTAQSPGEAIRIMENYMGTVDLLITDIIMPEMNGEELSRRLLMYQPGMKCLFMSGYSADAISRQGVLLEGVHLLQKPFSRKELGRAVRDLLQEKSRSGMVNAAARGSEEFRGDP